MELPAKNRLAVALVLATLILIPGLSNPSNAAGLRPVINIDCGQIVGGVDQYGTYGLFKPRMFVKHYGKPLKIRAYFYDSPTATKSEAGQSLIDFTGKVSSSVFFNSEVNLERKILPYSQPQTGYYKIVIDAIDSLNRKASFTCQYKKYYFNTPITDPVTGYSSGGLNKVNCTFDQKKLFGNVQIVSYGEDVSAQIVDYGQDLRVQEVDYGANSCGLWRIVDYGADLKVKLVTFGGDIRIRLVDYGAGL
jgi:hypothetical protein